MPNKSIARNKIQKNIIEKNITKVIDDKKNKIIPIKIIHNKVKIKKIKSDKNLSISFKNNNNNSDLLQLNTKFLTHIYKEKANTNKIKTNIQVEVNNSKNNFSNDKNVQTNNTTTNIIKKQMVNIEKKPKIIISSKKIGKIKYLKERYYETRRAFYAILISKEYYRKKYYVKSLFWATRANSIDSSNEESWIMFAKNKVKLGKRKDAIKALTAYLKIDKSKKIRILLTNIKNGVFR